MLILSFVEWSGAFQRPQHLAVGFARRRWDVTYVSPGYVHRRRQRTDSGLALPDSLRVFEPFALPGARKLAAVGRLNELSVERAVKKLSRAPWDAIVFNDPRWAGLAARLPGRRRVWDHMDDLTHHAPSEDWVRAREAEGFEAADRVWTGTASLADRHARAGREARFIPCGVDGEAFAHPDPERVHAARAEIDAAFLAGGQADATPDRPLAGYFGVLNERIEPRLLEALAGAGWRVLLIGPDSSQRPSLARSNSIRWIGPRPYASLPAYLACMDLALIPYDTNGPHRFLYPVKALEYLAGAKPVLSSPLPDVVRFLDEFVLVRDTSERWAEVARHWGQMADEAATRAARGQAYALQRSWDGMIDVMSEELDHLAGVPDR